MRGTGTGLQPPSAGRRDWTRSLSSRLRSPTGGGGGRHQGREGGAAVHPGGPQNLLHPAGQGGAGGVGGKQESPAFFDNLEKMTVKPQRPVSLSLTPVTVKNIEGVPIDTPSNGILSFNTLLEGRTGLTPTNILTPTSLWTPIKTNSNLNTPNCGSQERRLIVTDLLSPSTQALLPSL